MNKIVLLLLSGNENGLVQVLVLSCLWDDIIRRRKVAPIVGEEARTHFHNGSLSSVIYVNHYLARVISQPYVKIVLTIHLNWH